MVEPGISICVINVAICFYIPPARHAFSSTGSEI